MKIAIIGGGSIGLLVAGYLASKHDVHLIVNRQAQVESIQKKGLQLKKQGQYTIIKEMTVGRMNMENLFEADVYIVCVKQPQLQKVLPFIESLPLSIPVIFLQNGMSHLETIQKLSQVVYIGIVNHGATRKSDHQVEHLGNGTIQLARFRNAKIDLHTLVNQLNQSDFPFTIETDWEQIVKYKMLINCVINPLTALFNISNEDIILHLPLSQIARKLSDETATVLNLDQNEGWKKVRETALKTGKNTSSMLQDIQKGNQTELNAMTGYILQEAENDVPYTRFVYEAVLAMERRDN